MTQTDCGFPVIEYQRDSSPHQWGAAHGESWREAIRELAAIRTGLMREKNPGLTAGWIGQLAEEQWRITERYAPDLAEELRGIAAGAACTLQDIVVLNNYTDFRDIQVPDQGCSVIYANRGEGRIAGQTWDMHRSAKNYVCCLRVPSARHGGETTLFSLVGCVGLMGFHASGGMVGVNNINTSGARPGVLWPALVRRLLECDSHAEMLGELQTAPVTSGHSYLVVSREQADFWEVMPGLAELVGTLAGAETGHLFHTNHCEGAAARTRELPLALSSTTHVRHELIARKIGAVRDLETAWALLNDHENYPKSICSNFQASAQDPSVTCGGAVGNLDTGELRMWRGDREHDANFVLREFRLADQDRNRERVSHAG